MKTKKIFTNVRVIIFLVVLLLAVVAIHPSLDSGGVTIRSVEKNSSADIAGIKNPDPNTAPMSKEKIIAINNVDIKDRAGYYNYTSTLEPFRVITIKTNKGLYKLETKSDALGNADLGINVYKAPTSNIRKGIDLEGGTRVLLKPEEKVSQNDMEMLLASMKQRLNIYGLSDVVVRTSNDLSGNQYILVEIAGVNEQEVKELLAKQGKFEARIGNKTVFRGGTDIVYVCRSSDCSGIDLNTGCSQIQDGWACRFRFSISLTEEAAERQANLTKNLAVIMENDDEYLNESLELYLDNENVDTLRIGADLKGMAITNIAISGSGLGNTQQEAVLDSLKNMKRLQTILITGSLPVSLEIVKTDTLSPSLGKEFLDNAFLIGLIAILVVGSVVFIRYKEWIVTLTMMTMVGSEVLIILGAAALVGWNIDLAAIAGIIIAVGSGVDHLIIISDETLGKEKGEFFVNWKERIKRALFIIMGAYLTTVVAMIPLLRAGAGLLKGFALTTIIGVSIGVLITRPTYAKIIEILKKD